jgi:hypothetical protein
MPPDRRLAFGADLFRAAEASRNSISLKEQIARHNTWIVWTRFCQDHGQDPFLSSYPEDRDKLDFFVVFALRYRRGELSKSGNAVRSGSVENALLAVGTRFADLGSHDPRKDSAGHLVRRLKTLLRFLKDEDPASTRVWPVNVTILDQLHATLADAPDYPRQRTIFNLCVIAFFYLCRPGEYALSSNADTGRSSPFLLQDVTFSNDEQSRYPAATCACDDVHRGTFATLTYTDQKNAVRGEAIGQHSSGHPYLDPILALRDHVLHLRSHSSTPDTPLYRYYDETGRSHDLRTIDITRALRTAAALCQHRTNIPPAQIEARSLRAGGATALMVAGKDNDTIRLLGRWKSDAMFRYLRTMAMEYSASFSRDMLTFGRYTFSPTTPPDPTFDLTPTETPPDIINALTATLADTQLLDDALTDLPDSAEDAAGVL